jgi:hypothetical protein
LFPIQAAILSFAGVRFLRQQLRQGPYSIRDPRFHCRRDSQGFVDTAKIVKSAPNRVSRAKVLPLFTEGICKTRHAAHPHAVC